jgi:5-methylcytosine-specific restriction endonuclease McrA
VLLRDDGRCHICGEYGATEVDHVVPLSPLADPAGGGGADDPSNLAPAHIDCHAKKTAEEAARARVRTRGVTPAG